MEETSAGESSNPYSIEKYFAQKQVGPEQSPKLARSGSTTSSTKSTKSRRQGIQAFEDGFQRQGTKQWLQGKRLKWTREEMNTFFQVSIGNPSINGYAFALAIH